MLRLVHNGGDLMANGNWLITNNGKFQLSADGGGAFAINHPDCCCEGYICCTDMTDENCPGGKPTSWAVWASGLNVCLSSCAQSDTDDPPEWDDDFRIISPGPVGYPRVDWNFTDTWPAEFTARFLGTDCTGETSSLHAPFMYAAPEITISATEITLEVHLIARNTDIADVATAIMFSGSNELVTCCEEYTIDNDILASDECGDTVDGLPVIGYGGNITIVPCNGNETTCDGVKCDGFKTPRQQRIVMSPDTPIRSDPNVCYQESANLWITNLRAPPAGSFGPITLEQVAGNPCYWQSTAANDWEILVDESDGEGCANITDTGVSRPIVVTLYRRNDTEFQIIVEVGSEARSAVIGVLYAGNSITTNGTYNNYRGHQFGSGFHFSDLNGDYQGVPVMAFDGILTNDPCSGNWLV